MFRALIDLLKKKKNRTDLDTARQQFHSLKPNTHRKLKHFDLNEWQHGLKYHPPPTQQYLKDGMQNGFRMGITRAIQPETNQHNLKCSTTQKTAIYQWLIEEVQAGHMIGPSRHPPIPNMHWSPIGAVPKDIVKFRVIHHLSAPRKHVSVNSLVHPALSTVTYITFKDIAEFVFELGKGSFLWKIDLKAAYRHLAIHTDDLKYFGMKWDNLYLVDAFLGFGCSSSPLIFTIWADTIQFYVIDRFPSIFPVLREDLWMKNFIAHYLDDFFGGHKDPAIAQQQYEALLQACFKLNVTTSPKKCIPPTTCIDILGHRFNTIDMTAGVSPERINRLTNEIDRAIEKRSHTKRELLSLIGHLRWCSPALFGSNAFLCSLTRRSTHAKEPHHHVHLDSENKADLQWWKHTLLQAKFTPLQIILKPFENNDLFIFTDGALSQSKYAGIGGYRTDTMQYFHASFQAPDTTDINALEMGAVLIACLLWKDTLSNKRIHFRCDNQPAVTQLEKQRIRKDRIDLRTMLKQIINLCTKNNIYYCISYISTDHNTIADGLSRQQANPQFCTSHKLTTDCDCVHFIDNLCEIFKLNTK